MGDNMKPTIFALVVLIWIGFMASAAICASSAMLPAQQGTQTCAKPAADAKTELTNLVKNILTQGGWEGKGVTIVGYYRGWDLLRETNQAPPVTRSDWVIKDQSGAIYFQAKSTEIRGQEKLGGKGLRPNRKESVNHVVKLTGTVRMTQQKQAYIEPKSMEILK
jgi:hypothetical protein